MINPKQLRDLVIVPTLVELGLMSDSAVELLLGTAAQESHLGSYIKQVGAGPALGIYQMEPGTHDDIWKNFLKYKPELRQKVLNLLPAWLQDKDPSEFSGQLVGNLYYATAMTRVFYYRKIEPLPPVGDTYKQAQYWKLHYNTYLGKGTEAEYMHNYSRMIKF